MSGKSAGGGEGTLGPPSSKVQGFPKAGRGLGAGQGEEEGGHSGCEEAQLPHRRLPRRPVPAPCWSLPAYTGWGGSAVPIRGHGHQHLALAHLLQGTCQAVEVPVVLLQSLPEVQDHTRGARFGGKVVQVPERGKEDTGLPRCSALPRSLG